MLKSDWKLAFSACYFRLENFHIKVIADSDQILYM